MGRYHRCVTFAATVLADARFVLATPTQQAAFNGNLTTVVPPLGAFGLNDAMLEGEQ